MNKKVMPMVAALMLTAGFFGNSVSAEKISTPITGWQTSFWNRPEGEGLGDDAGGVEITSEPEWVFAGNGALHIWVGNSLPNFNAQAVQNIDFEQDEDYHLTGKLYISSTSWGFGLYIGSDRLAMLREFASAGEWADIDYTFKYQSNSSDFKLQVAQVGELYADDLSPKKVLYDKNGEVIGYGEELLENGDFESDYLPSEEVTDLTAEAADSAVVLRWRNPDDERLESIVIFEGENEIQTVTASEQSAVIDGLENGVTYNFTVKTQTRTGILSEGCEVSVTPYKVIPTPKIIKDDKENRIIGITEEMEYSIDGGQSWTRYNLSQPPELSGRITVQVRYYSDDYGVLAPAQTLYFTPDSTAEEIRISKARFEGNELVLEGVLNRSETAVVTMYAVRQGEDRRDLTAVLAIGQTESLEDGSFSFRIPVAEQRNGKETDGFYDIYVDSAITDEVKCKGIAFAASQNIKSAVEALFTQADTAALLETDSEYYNTYLAMGMPLDEYQKNPERKSGITSDFKSLLRELNRNDVNIINNVCGAFVKAYIMNGLRYADAEETYSLLNEHLEYLELSYGDITLERLINENDPSLAFITEYMSAKTYEGYDDLNQAFAEGVALYEINKSTYGILPEVMDKHSSVLNLNSGEYYQYSALAGGSNEKIAASKAIVDIKSRTPFTSREAVLNAVKTAVSSSKTTGAASGGSGGGGGGGSSSGGTAKSSSVNFTATPQYTVQTETETIQKKIFSDLQSAQWAEESIEYLYQRGYVNGYDDGSFRPNNLITREEFVTILVNAFGLTDAQAQCGFQDVPEQAWFYRSVASAVKAGIVNGLDENSFGAGQNINREALAALAYRSLEQSGFEISSPTEAPEFTDKNQISEYAIEAISSLYTMEVISGYDDGSFLPKNTATRAEACKILHKILIILEGNR